MDITCVVQLPRVIKPPAGGLPTVDGGYPSQQDTHSGRLTMAKFVAIE